MSAARLTTRMRRDWERRAITNPLFHIDARQVDWAMDEFYAGGEVIVGTAVDPVLRRLGVDPTGRVALEIGPGMGRLFPALRRRFARVVGVELSPTMAALGQQHCPQRDATTWIVGDGHSLSAIADASIDHVVSFEVFQHIPELAPIEAYIGETRRVLRPGGTFQLQLRRGSDSRSQSVFRSLPSPVRAACGRVLQRVGALEVAGHLDTWLGCIVDPDEIVARALASGCCDVEVLDDELHATGMGFWLIGRVPAITTDQGPHGRPAAGEG